MYHARKYTVIRFFQMWSKHMSAGWLSPNGINKIEKETIERPSLMRLYFLYHQFHFFSLNRAEAYREFFHFRVGIELVTDIVCQLVAGRYMYITTIPFFSLVYEQSGRLC